MKWPWRRPKPDPAGLKEAKQMLAKARADEPRVARLVAEHRRKNAENHFAEKFKKALEA